MRHHNLFHAAFCIISPCYPILHRALIIADIDIQRKITSSRSDLLRTEESIRVNQMSAMFNTFVIAVPTNMLGLTILIQVLTAYLCWPKISTLNSASYSQHIYFRRFTNTQSQKTERRKK